MSWLTRSHRFPPAPPKPDFAAEVLRFQRARAADWPRKSIQAVDSLDTASHEVSHGLAARGTQGLRGKRGKGVPPPHHQDANGLLPESEIADSPTVGSP